MTRTAGLPPGLEELVAAVRPVDEARRRAARRRLDELAKPPGSLGRLERLAERLAAATGLPPAPLGRRAILVFAADHGVAGHGVSAYPGDVTAAVLGAIGAGDAGVSVVARASEAEVVAVDVGTTRPVDEPGVLSRRVAPGSDDLARGPALSDDHAAAAFRVGVELAREVSARSDVIGVGEVGIGNTTVAAALACALAKLPPEIAVGPGTGVEGDRLAAKRDIVVRAVARLPDSPDPWRALREVGGLEIAALAGAIVGAAGLGRTVVLDGYATGAAALVARGVCPDVAGWLFAGHRSDEPGHGAVLDDLGLEPILDLAMRLGEGTGAALAIPILDAAGAVLREMATLASVVER